MTFKGAENLYHSPYRSSFETKIWNLLAGFGVNLDV